VIAIGTSDAEPVAGSPIDTVPKGLATAVELTVYTPVEGFDATPIPSPPTTFRTREFPRGTHSCVGWNPETCVVRGAVGYCENPLATGEHTHI